MNVLGLASILLSTLTGCIPSLCLFNCNEGGSTESRTHRDGKDMQTFTQHGKRWSCSVEKAAYGERQSIRPATCFEMAD